IAILEALEAAGHEVDNHPRNGNALIEALLSGKPSHAETPHPSRVPRATLPAHSRGGGRLAIEDYLKHFESLPQGVRDHVTQRWGPPERDPFFRQGAFRLAVKTFGSVAVAIQPARGYNIDPKSTYHDPALVPPHGYFAFYFWLRHVFGAHAVIHNGKHGNLEWLPGKAAALSP